MKVRVLHFGQLREARGLYEETVEIAGGSTLRQLFESLFDGPLRGLPIAYARNAVYAASTDVLREDDEVAFLPPVGGG